MAKHEMKVPATLRHTASLAQRVRIVLVGLVVGCALNTAELLGESIWYAVHYMVERGDVDSHALLLDASPTIAGVELACCIVLWTMLWMYTEPVKYVYRIRILLLLAMGLVVDSLLVYVTGTMALTPLRAWPFHVGGQLVALLVRLPLRVMMQEAAHVVSTVVNYMFGRHRRKRDGSASVQEYVGDDREGAMLATVLAVMCALPTFTDAGTLGDSASLLLMTLSICQISYSTEPLECVAFLAIGWLVATCGVVGGTVSWAATVCDVAVLTLHSPPRLIGALYSAEAGLAGIMTRRFAVFWALRSFSV